MPDYVWIQDVVFPLIAMGGVGMLRLRDLSHRQQDHRQANEPWSQPEGDRGVARRDRRPSLGASRCAWPESPGDASKQYHLLREVTQTTRWPYPDCDGANTVIAC